MLDSLPVSKTRIGVESGKNSGCIGNVWPHGKGQPDTSGTRQWRFMDSRSESRQGGVGKEGKECLLFKKKCSSKSALSEMITFLVSGL
jgi:hypothetical protein